MSRFSNRATVLAMALAIPFCATRASANSESVFYAFTGHGTHDGFRPAGGLIADTGGNLYGITWYGGSAHLGTVFKLTPQGAETILHNFTGGHDGVHPGAELLLDADGNLFGTTTDGGDHDGGTVFRIAPDGTETILYAFAGGSDGKAPEAELIEDESGNLYGTTAVGGASNFGTVFKLAPDGAETVLYSFQGGDNDGAIPRAGLWRDGSGNLYGTTSQGLVNGGGIVFKISPDGTETVLHSFIGGAHEATPTATLVPDGKGNLYGTTNYGGGPHSRRCPTGCGAIFKIAQDDSYSLVYSFPNVKAGNRPSSRLLVGGGKRTILYGTTEVGGTIGRGGWGTVFKVTLNGKETVLHSFTNRLKGEHLPSGPLTADSTFTHLFGETFNGGMARGTVYVLRP